MGREAELAELHELLQDSDRVAIAAATGMGGVGKTELAWQYAVKHRDLGHYPAGIWWLSVREQDLAVQVLAKADRMGIARPDQLDGAELVRFCYDQWAARTEGPGLLVLDDVPDYGRVRSQLPQNPRLKVLMTTRQTLGSPVRCLPLAVLKPEVALQLLQQIVGAARLEDQQDEAKALCAWLGNLPLGIELVGRYLVAKPDLRLTEMQQRLHQQRLTARALKLPEELQGEARPYENLTAAFELSWQDLPAAAQQLACCLSLFALAPIPWPLVEACYPDCDREDLEDWRDAGLVKLHLLERTAENQYQLHQLVREFFALQCATRADVSTLQTRFAAALTEVARTIPYGVTLADMARVQAAIPHLEVATDYAGNLPEDDQIAPLTRLAWFYQGQSLWQSAERWSTACLAYAERQFESDHPSVATSLNNLALLYKSQGRYSEAELLFLRDLEISERQLGADHPDVATSLNNLGYLYNSQGRYSEAEPLFLRALDIREQQLRADHPDVAASLNNLANLYESQGRYSEAEPLFLRALHIWERQFGSDHPFVATSFNNLANLYESQGRYSEAEPLHLKALNIRERQLGADHPSVATSLNNLAYLYESQRRYSEAEPCYLRALEIWERQLGADHPDVATTLNNLAYLYKSQGHYNEAEPLFLRAVEIRTAKLGENHPKTQKSWENFRRLLQQAIEAGQAEQLSDHPMTQDLLAQMQAEQTG